MPRSRVTPAGDPRLPGWRADHEQTRRSPRPQAISVRNSVSPSIASVLAHRCRRSTAINKSANPLDYAPNWSGKNYLGLAWSFVPKRYAVTQIEGGIFLQGDLIATRGGTTDKNVFVLFDEWKCGSLNEQ